MTLKFSGTDENPKLEALAAMKFFFISSVNGQGFFIKTVSVLANFIGATSAS